MPDKEFIHSTADVVSTLLYALDSGLQVMLDEPQPEPRPRMVTREEVGQMQGGVFFLTRPEWVFGPYQISRIAGGYYEGKYDISPRANYAPITLYFQGERIKEGKRLFGSGFLSFHHEWLEMPAKALWETPPEVKTWANRIAAHMLSKVVIKGGVHRYHICKGVLASPAAAQCQPPFDYIPWSEELLHPPASGGRTV